MNKYGVRPSVMQDVRVIANDMRSPDVDEIWASAHARPHEALVMSFLGSRDTCFTGVADGEPVCMFGVREPSQLGSVAVPWMLASNKLEFHSKEFLRRSRDMVRVLAAEFPHMENFVDQRNTISVRWLQWVGFSVYYPKPYGKDKLPFHRFDMRS
jgi:hypothetical protein